MPKWMALIFALIGILLLTGISFFISLRDFLGSALCGGAALLWIGSGFILKARARRREGNMGKAGSA